MYFYQLLTDLHESFSPQKAEETVAFIRHQLNFDTLYREHDGLTVQMLINDQHPVFYKCLARELVADLSANPNHYFRDWQPLLALFNQRSINLLLAHSVEQAGHTQTSHLLQGLWHLHQPQTAIYHFHQLHHPISHYFIGRCYTTLQAWHNAIKQYNHFLDHLDARWVQHAEAVEQDEIESEHLVMAQWNADKELGYIFCQLGKYTEAVQHFQLAFGYFPADYLYELSVGRVGSEATLFHTMVHHYLLALEKTGDYNTALEVLTTARQHLPFHTEYTTIQQRCQTVVHGHHYAHQLLAQVLPAAVPSQAPPTLQHMVLAQIEQEIPVFNRRLTLYEEETISGCQYYVAGADAFVDLLLQDEHTLYAVLCPPIGAGPVVVDQLERIIEALATQLAIPVRGIICLSAPNEHIQEAIESHTPIEVYTCQLGFNPLR